MRGPDVRLCPVRRVHALRRHRTGFEETKDFPIRMHDLIAGRYQVVDFLGSAAFSRAVQALDVKTNMLVCLKIIKVRVAKGVGEAARERPTCSCASRSSR